MLAGLIFAAFPQVLLGLQAFVIRDFGFFAYPLAHYQRECFWRGELPLWNPYNNCGIPFLAQWNTMPLYPPALIYLLLPLDWSLSFFCLLHLFLAGMGTYFLARRWTGNDSTAAVAGVIFAFNGLSLNLLMWPSHIATLSWMPWVVLAVERAWQQGGRCIVVAALVGTFQMLAGGPETILLTWLLVLGLGVGECLRGVGSGGRALVQPGEAPAGPGRASTLGAALRLFLVVLLVAGLASAQLLPFLDLVAHSQRGQDYADTRWSMPAWGWANFLVPMVFGKVWNNGVFFQHEQAWTSSYYLGTGALLLVLLAVVTVQGHRARLLGIVAGASLLLSFGEHSFVYRWVRHLIPQVSMMTYPVKFLLVVAFVAPLLAGFAFDQLQRQSGREKAVRGNRVIALGGLLMALVGVILLWAWKFPFPDDDFPAALRNGLARAVFLLAAVILLVAVSRCDRPANRQWLSLLLVAVLWSDVLTHVPPQNPTAPPWIYAQDLARTRLAMNPQPGLGESRAMVRPAAEIRFTQVIASDPKDNYLAKRMGYFANCNLLDAVPKVNGFFSLYPRECGELGSVLYGSTNTCLESLADFLSVSQVTAPGQFVGWARRDSFLPFVTAGQSPVYLDDTNALLAMIRPGFDAHKIVILPMDARPGISATNRAAPRIVPGRIAAELVELEVESDKPSMIVFSQTYYHPWRAYVDGCPVHLLRANYAFQALEAPAGRHRVRLAYEDRAFWLGVGVSGLSLSFCLGFWILARTPRRDAVP